jgi:cholesterol transport system auxiliary component
MKPAVLLVLSAGLLTACSSILPQRGAAPDLYQLSPVALPAVKKPAAAQIVVDAPLAARGLDTDRIIVRGDSYEVKYLSGVRWTDRIPRLVQSALVQGLESTGAFTGVGRPEDGLKSNYALLSDLRAFDVVSQGMMGSARVQVVLAAKLVRPGGDVVASRLITKEAEAKGSGNGGIVAAFDEAVKGAAEETTQWVVANAAASSKSAPSAAAEITPAPATPGQP